VIGLRLLALDAKAPLEIDAAFATLAQQRVGALVVSGDILFVSQRDQVLALAAQHAVPTIYVYREVAVAGGLMSYGTDLADGYRQEGVYAGRILKGDRPGDLPVEQLTKIELVLNRKTAQTLGLTFPETLLLRSTEVIE
jgi:putative tryptophan/tyrosine transport system substrate-binding protein